MKTFCVTDECFDFDLWVVCPAQAKQVDAFLKRKFKIDDPLRKEDFQGHFIEILDDETDEELAGLIALKQWNNDPASYDVLAHECLHAVQWFLTRRGIRLSFKTDESYSYLLGSLVRRISEKLNKK